MNLFYLLLFFINYNLNVIIIISSLLLVPLVKFWSPLLAPFQFSCYITRNKRKITKFIRIFIICCSLPTVSCQWTRTVSIEFLPTKYSPSCTEISGVPIIPKVVYSLNHIRFLSSLSCYCNVITFFRLVQSILVTLKESDYLFLT